MHIDHFDGKSIRWRTQKWLTAALANVAIRKASCRREGNAAAHLKMWTEIGARYEEELRNRRVTRGRHPTKA